MTGALLPFYEEVMEQRGQVYVVKDGAPVHRCATAKNFRESNQICSLSHPPQSPDMNPIEHVWKRLKTNINKHSKHPQNAAELENMIMEAWKEIDQDFINSLISSMPRCVKALVDAKGGVIKY